MKKTPVALLNLSLVSSLHDTFSEIEQEEVGGQSCHNHEKSRI